MIFKVEQFVHDSKNKCYTAEMSELQLKKIPSSFTIINCPEAGMNRSFRLSHTDISGGDVMGWNFVEDYGPVKVLIIND